jgi:hypothetical protein
MEICASQLKKMCFVLQPLLKDYDDFALTIDKLNEVGYAHEVASRRGDSAVTPIRRSMYTDYGFIF